MAHLVFVSLNIVISESDEERSRSRHLGEVEEVPTGLERDISVVKTDQA